MTADPYQRGPMVLPPFTKGARIVLGVIWIGFLAWLVAAKWMNVPWAERLALDPVSTLIGLEFWRVVTHVFVNEPLSLVLTSLVVWWFGGPLDERWGTGAFLRFCAWTLVLGSVGAFFVVPIAIFAPPNSPILAVCGPTFGPVALGYGVTAAWATLYPDRTIYLLLFLPIRARWIIALSLGILVLLVIAQQTPLATLFVAIAACGVGWLLVTGQWRPSRWRKPKPITRAQVRRSAGGGGLRVIRGGRDEADDDDDDDDGDSLPPKPKYLN